ncbi:asparagine synthase-related protein [Alkalicoccus luteus]|uniref:asparagine synthase (glutamine-hydrolyzing) n=1 Tax=Alkalicoccus luteus TaxID=1237094 RepID=A0A969PPK0_9BACI|nr:asparagine synthase-related protein [Alkalicoccus luteus]NJP38030.1 asparagine synthetase B [Alkalicoccus luteus]
MGAIAAIISESPQLNNSLERLTECLKSYQHEALNQLYYGRAGFSCAHQWVTPESEGEILPLLQNNYMIVADCIIDNRYELSQDLGIKTSHSKLMSDTQLILESYKKWGNKCVKKLIGDFAFIIWDSQREVCFAARDFSGTRTLYFSHTDDYLTICTTMEPLLRAFDINPEINEAWVAEYIAIPTFLDAVTVDSTIYTNIKQIPPSHSLEYKAGTINIKKYAAIDFTKQIVFQSDDQYEEMFRNILERAVRDRLRTNGKIGTYLSGGLDSTSVTAFAARNAKDKLYSYSVLPKHNFQDWTDKSLVPDESEYIQSFLELYPEIKPTFLRFEDQSLLSNLNNQISILETPFKFVPNMFWLEGVTYRAKQDGVKVLLNGARGNFTISHGSLEINLSAYRRLIKRGKLIKVNKELKQFCNYYRTGRKKMFPYLLKKEVLSQGVYESIIDKNFAACHRTVEKLSSIGLTERGLKNPALSRNNHFLHDGSWNKNGVLDTKMSLETGVWNRDPTNDLRLIQFCLAIPEEQFWKNGLDRSLIRRSMKEYLPVEIITNYFSRGMQAADTILRLEKEWNDLINEFKEMLHHPLIRSWTSTILLHEYIKELENAEGQEELIKLRFVSLIRLLTLYRLVVNKERKGVKL